MNFNCDNCNARYFIPDERVKGRRVTITCKRCSHKIHIRDGAVASQSGQVGAKHVANKPNIAVAPPPPVASPRVKKEKPVWVVAINDVPVGPLPIAEIARKAKLGAVTLESLCWREGLEEWIPIAEVEEIRTAVEKSVGGARASDPGAAAAGQVEDGAGAARAAVGPAKVKPPVRGGPEPSIRAGEAPAVQRGALPEAWAADAEGEPSMRISESDVEERTSLPLPPISERAKSSSVAPSQAAASSEATHEAPASGTSKEAAEGRADAGVEERASSDASLEGADEAVRASEPAGGASPPAAKDANEASGSASRPSLSLRKIDRDPTPRTSRVSLSGAEDWFAQEKTPIVRFAVVGLVCGVLGYLLGFWHGGLGEKADAKDARAGAREATSTTRETASGIRRPLGAQLRFDESLAIENEGGDAEGSGSGEDAPSTAASGGSSSAMAATGARTTTRLRPSSSGVSSSGTSSGATASRTDSTAPSSEMRALSAEEKRMLESFSAGGSAPKLGSLSSTGPTSQIRSTQAGSAPARSAAGLDSAAISRVISQNQPSLQQCYERAVRGMPIAQSLRINVHVVIGASGTVTRAQASGDSLPGLNTCIENAVKRWQFPAAPGGGETRFPVVFSGK